MYHSRKCTAQGSACVDSGACFAHMCVSRDFYNHIAREFKGLVGTRRVDGYLQILPASLFGHFSIIAIPASDCNVTHLSFFNYQVLLYFDPSTSLSTLKHSHLSPPPTNNVLHLHQPTPRLPRPHKQPWWTMSRLHRPCFLFIHPGMKPYLVRSFSDRIL